MKRNIAEAKKEFAAVKEAYESALEESSTLAEDTSLDDNDPRFIEMIDRMERLSNAYHSLLWVTL